MYISLFTVAISVHYTSKFPNVLKLRLTTLQLKLLPPTAGQISRYVCLTDANSRRQENEMLN